MSRHLPTNAEPKAVVESHHFCQGFLPVFQIFNRSCPNYTSYHFSLFRSTFRLNISVLPTSFPRKKNGRARLCFVHSPCVVCQCVMYRRVYFYIYTQARCRELVEYSVENMEHLATHVACLHPGSLTSWYRCQSPRPDAITTARAEVTSSQIDVVTSAADRLIDWLHVQFPCPPPSVFVLNSRGFLALLSPVNVRLLHL